MVLRGYTKHGHKIGSHKSEQGKIYLNGQSWAVSLGVASPERAISADGRHQQGCSTRPTACTCVTPAFSEPDDEIGYVTRVYKGIKENAAIFSHPNPWAIIAEPCWGVASGQ